MNQLKENIKIGGLFKSDKELGEIANEIVFLLSQRQVLHFEVEKIFEIINNSLKQSPVSYQDIVNSIKGTLNLHK